MVVSQKQLSQLIARLDGQPVVALDTEFMREKTYWPHLCLLQVAIEDESWLVDPLSYGLDLRPFGDVLGNPQVLKLFHASGQDLQILEHETGVAPCPIFDTQDAAALLGYPEQIGYGPLVRGVLGVRLGKADGFTDWARRPLSADQLRYAEEDVTWLFRMYPEIIAELGRLGREHWLDEDFARKADPAHYVVDPREQYLRLKRVGQLRPRQLAIARELAEWREETAQQRNLPRRWLMSDEAVLEIARRAPATREALLDLRGVTLKGRHYADQVLAAVRRGVDLPDDRLPETPGRAQDEREITVSVELMTALARTRASENRLSPTVLASRALLEELVLASREARDSCTLMTGWRRAMIGEELARLLDGRLELSLVDGVLQVRERA